MPLRKLLITGGSGYLGRYLTTRASTLFDVYAGYHTRPDVLTAGTPVLLDITDPDAVRQSFDAVQPDAVINTAALNPGRPIEQMETVNALGAGYVAENAHRLGIRLVQVSTDIVHDGRCAPYADDAAPSPINEYGRTKAAGESAIREICPDAAIVRTSLIYGVDAMDRGTRGFAERLHLGEPLILFHDVIRQPVWIETLSDALLRLVDIKYAGLLNIAGCQALSREDFGKRMLAFWNVPFQDRITSGSGAEISDKIPLDLRLTLDQAQNVLNMDLPGVDDVLQEIRRTKVR